MKNFKIALAIVLVVALIGWFLPVKTLIERAGGLVHNTFETFDGGIGHDGHTRMTDNGEFVFGGGGAIAFRQTSASYTTAQLCDYGLIRHNPVDPNATVEDELQVGASVSFPTSAALITACIPNPGDRIEVWVENTSTTSAQNIEFDDNDEYEMFKPGDTGPQTIITENEMGLLKFFNLDGTSVSVTFEMYLLD